MALANCWKSRGSAAFHLWDTPILSLGFPIRAVGFGPRMNQNESEEGGGRTWQHILVRLARPGQASSPETEGQMGDFLAGGQGVWETSRKMVSMVKSLGRLGSARAWGVCCPGYAGWGPGQILIQVTKKVNIGTTPEPRLDPPTAVPSWKDCPGGLGRTMDRPN